MDVFFALLFPILLSLVWAVLFSLVRREDAKHTGEGVFRVQTARAIRVFFAVFSAIVMAGMVAVAILAFVSLNTTAFLIAEGVLAAFAGLGIFGYVHTKFTYCVVHEDHLLRVRLFGKNHVIPFERIAYILSYGEGFGNLSGFDANGIPLFGFDHTEVGVEALETRLREWGIPDAPKPFPTEAMKNSEPYRAYKKRSNRLALGVTCGLWGAIILTFVIIWIATR